MTMEYKREEEEPGNEFGFRCPECKKDDLLWIVANTICNLFPASIGNPRGVDNSWWSDESGAGCDNCKWTGNVSALHDAA